MRKGTVVDPERLDLMLSLFAAGWSHKRIGNHLGVSAPRVTEVLHCHKELWPANRVNVVAERRARIVMLYLELRLSAPKVAKRCQCSVQTVYLALREAGVSRRKRRRNNRGQFY